MTAYDQILFFLRPWGIGGVAPIIHMNDDDTGIGIGSNGIALLFCKGGDVVTLENPISFPSFGQWVLDSFISDEIFRDDFDADAAGFSLPERLSETEVAANAAW